VKTTFRDRVVIVTGASSGIGRETALAFARAGARVVLASRNETRLRELAALEPERMLAVPTDVTRQSDIDRLFGEVIARFGRIDILVNNAGIGMRAAADNVRPEDARRVFDVNFFGLLHCTLAALPHMKRQRSGQIVNVGSVLSVLAIPRNSIYCASKFAVRAFSEALRLELRNTGIEVILILPGYTDTPFFDNLIRCEGPPRLTPFKGQHPARVARAILRACARHRREVVLTAAGKFGVWMKRFAPRLLDFVLERSR
jgi:short-subunit dehydrogenase